VRAGHGGARTKPGHQRALATALALASLAALGGCKKSERTMLVFEVDSNLRPAVDLDRAELTVTLSGKTTTTVFPLAGVGGFGLPVRLGVVEARDGLGPVTVVATAFLGSASVVHETAVVNFVEGQSRLLKLYLAAECRSDPCVDSAMTCSTGGSCRPKARTPSDLVPVDAKANGPQDAAVDNGVAAARDVGLANSPETRELPDLGDDLATASLPDLALDRPLDTGGDALDAAPDKAKATPDADASLHVPPDTALPADSQAGQRDGVASGQLDGSAVDTPTPDALDPDAVTPDTTPDAFVPVPPSCQPLAANCGFSGQESCCASLPVPGGDFDRSNDPLYPATVDGFRLDEFEVTVGRFRAFMSAGGGTQASPPAAGAGAHPRIAGSGWDASWNGYLAVRAASLRAQLKCDASALPLHAWTWTDDPGGNENRPLNCVDWYTAFAFCAWDGGRLPTEAEWNFAAAGGSEQRDYPWGYGIDNTNASYSCSGDGNYTCTVTDLLPVGSKPAGNGRWGHADLAGNVIEWTLDWFVDYAVPCVNCASLTPGAALTRGIRGGAFTSQPPDLASEHRVGDSPSVSGYPVGFRCARAL